MLYALTTSSHSRFKSTQIIQGHIGDDELKTILNIFYDTIPRIQVDGDELIKCCHILGRQLPYNQRSYVFLGDTAREIAINW